MNFLDNLVLPQSSEHIRLLQYILMLIQFLSVPFISILFAGTILSLFYRFKGFNEGNKEYLRFSRDIIDISTINKSIGIILGIIPILVSVLIFVQLLHTTGSTAIVYLLISFLLAIPGIILIYTYRYSVLFNDMFNNLKELKIDDAEVRNDVSSFRESSKNLSSRSGVYGIVLLFLSIYFFVTAQTTITYNYGNSVSTLFSFFSFITIIRVIEFMSGALALLGGTILFVYFYWDGGRVFPSETLKGHIRKTGIYLSLIGSLSLPIFLTVDILALPGKSVSGSLITYAIIGIILLFIAYHLIYAIMKNSYYQYSGQLFFLLLFAIFAFIIKDQLAMSNVIKPNSAILAANYDVYLKALKGEDKTGAKVDGEQIFKNICSSCHSFDHKIVGPPYNETLPKYEGKINQLVAFIRNPVKVNPNYPPMPNPGIKPNEAQAVAEYILKTYKK